MLDETHCPLCSATGSLSYHKDRHREYRQCPRCQLVFVPPAQYVSRAEERAEYDLHCNRLDDLGYRRFLSRLMLPLIERIPERAEGLDFGCGSGPALADMLRERGFGVALYDSFYWPELSVFGRRYDFISATEVVEHLHQPGWELARLWSCLRDGGWLAVMTKLVRNPRAFAGWHYKNDRTHVCFFSRETWLWWAEQQGTVPEFVADDVVLLRRG
ncbi:MAG: class I SAM-dependent methyltransferase [Pseudomonadota bacterium]